jgi:hypothetical protein
MQLLYNHQLRVRLKKLKKMSLLKENMSIIVQLFFLGQNDFVSCFVVTIFLCLCVCVCVCVCLCAYVRRCLFGVGVRLCRSASVWVCFVWVVKLTTCRSSTFHVTINNSWSSTCLQVSYVSGKRTIPNLIQTSL